MFPEEPSGIRKEHSDLSREERKLHENRFWSWGHMRVDAEHPKSCEERAFPSTELFPEEPSGIRKEPSDLSREERKLYETRVGRGGT